MDYGCGGLIQVTKKMQGILMKKTLVAASVLVAVAMPVMAQDMAALTCLEYGEMDDGGKMQIIAELEAMNSQMDTVLTNAEIQAKLTQYCGGAPELLVVEVFEE